MATRSRERIESGDRDPSALRQLLTHVPDTVITCDHSHSMPNITHMMGVCMFADISGFTSLCETYGQSATTSCGTEKLTATLNIYIGKIVEDILVNGGDVLKFAGDAILATWKSKDCASDLNLLVNKAIICSLAIQEECDNYMTDVGVLLRVKLAISIGKMHITYVGLPECKHFDLTGQAVEDVNKAEKWATPGSIILTRLAWKNCDQSLFSHDVMEDGLHFRVNGVRVQETQVGEEEPSYTSVVLMSMAGMLSTKSVTLAIPTVSRRIFGPHVGSHFTKHHPDLKLSRIYLKKSEANNRTTTGKLMRTGSVHNPDHRTDVYNKLNDQDIEDLRAYVSKPVLSKIDHGQDLQWLSEMRQVSVLFINMVMPDKGDHSAWALQTAFEIIYENVRRLRGNLNKVFSFDKGCTFLVIFGFPGDKHEDDQKRALVAGHRIIDALHAVSEITHEAIGVTTGRAFCGVVGHRDRHEYTVIGRRVNMAARLMVNYPGVLSCDNETYTVAKSKLKKEDFLLLPTKPLKGISEPGPVREYNRNHDREIEDDETEYPILGRQKEVDEMKTLLHAVKSDDDTHTAGNRRLAIVEGEGGIGKTRLIEEFMDIAEDEDFRVDYVEADMTHAHTPYYVVQMLITILLELENCRTPAEREHALKEHITDEALRNDICLLNDLLGTHIPPNVKFSHMDSGRVTEHFHKLLFGIVHQVAVEKPCLFVVDNAQYIDQESWDFLEDLQQDSHAVLVLALRPFSSANPPCKAAVRMINHEKTMKFKLAGLDGTLMSALAFQFMDVMYLPKELDKILKEKSHGVASWCEQLIKDMLMSKIIEIVPEKQAFAAEVGNSESMHESKCDILRPDMSIFLSDKPLSRPGTPLSIEGRSTPTERTRRGSLFTKVFSDSAERSRQRRMSTGSAIESSEGASSFISVDAITNDNGINGYYNFNRENFVAACPNTMPRVTGSVCIIRPEVDISKFLVPESVNDMVLARVDRMSPGEQVTLKCASILGSIFSRDLIEALVPKSSKMKLDLVLYTLAREGILECASLVAQHQLAHNHHGFYDYGDPAHAHQHGHHHHHHHHHNVATVLHAPVLCACYADEGNKVLNLSRMLTANGPKKHCLFFKFVNSYVQETTYAVWLENQRKQLHERAAMFLESQAHKCKSCGGGGFVAGTPSQETSENSAQVAPVAGGPQKRRHTVSGTSRRSNSILSSSTAKRRQTIEMRENVKSKGAFSARAHERSSIVDAATLVSIKEMSGTKGNQEGPSRSQHFNPLVDQRINTDSISSALVSTSGYVNNAIVGRAVDDRRKSWLDRFWKKSSVTPQESDEAKAIRDNLESVVELTNRLNLIKEEQPLPRDGDSDFDAVDLKNCQCAEILASVFPQLVDHWRASGNTLKTMRYLTESGAAALATSANMQALSQLYEVKEIFSQTKKEEVIATQEEMARVENLIGQALFHMNRLDEALTHFMESLMLLGKKQPTSDMGVHVRIRKESLRHHLHVLFPGYFIGEAGDNSSRFIEQARCLGQMSLVYHAMHQNDRSLMSALQELNAAEEAEEDLHELLVAYAAVIECTHLVGWTSWGEHYERVGLDRCTDPRLYFNSEDLVAVGHLYCVSLAFRLSIGNIAGSIESAHLTLAIANQMNDLHMKISCLPLFVQALILCARLQECHELLKELNYTAIAEEDSHGRALYMCCCFDMLLEGGHVLESVDKIAQFTIKAATDPAFSGDTVPKFYLNASLAVWHARREEWENTDSFLSAALAFDPTKCEVFMSVHGLVKIIECQLLHLRATPKHKTLKHGMKKELKKLKKACHQFPVFHPRCIHLQAYHALLSNKGKSRSLLKKCISDSKASGLDLEAEWATAHLKHWYIKTKKLAEKYDGTVKFLLPPPTKK